MKSFLRNSYFILLLSVLVKSVVVAQVNSYPVNGIVKVALPASISFEEYVNPITSPIDLGISLNDQRFPVRSVFLSLRMEGPEGTVVSIANRVSYQLISGYNPIPKAVVAACFSPDNLSNLPPAYLDKAMPAGLYTFSFRVTDALTGAVLSLPISSAPVWIEASDSPVPVQPANYSALPASQVQNVIFQWLPRHTPNPNIEYEFTLTELPIANRGNLQNVFLSQPPLCKITSPIPTLLYDAKYPPLRQGAVYAWRVQAKPKFGIAPGKTSAFLNEGYSEIFSFLYEKASTKLNPPTDLKVAHSANYERINIDWKGEDNHLKYEVTEFYTGNGYKGVIKDGDFTSVKVDYKEIDPTLLNFQNEVEKGANNISHYDYRSRGSHLKDTRTFLVRAIDKFGRMSEPAVYVLEGLDEITFNKVWEKEVKIKVKIEGFSNQAKFSHAEMAPYLQDIGLIYTKEKIEKPPYLIDFFNPNKQNGPNKYGRIGFYERVGDEGVISMKYFQLQDLLRQNYYFYLMVRSDKSMSHDLLIQVSLPDMDANAEIRIPDQTLRILPMKVEVALKKTYDENGNEIDEGFSMDMFEEVNIYLPGKSVPKYLSCESGNKTITYNRTPYTQVCGNLPELTDVLVGLKEFQKDELFFPAKLLVNDIKRYTLDFAKEIGQKPSSIYHAFDYVGGALIKYVIPSGIYIRGKAAVRSGSETQGVGVPNLEVGVLMLDSIQANRAIRTSKKILSPADYNKPQKVHWEEIRTDSEGNYEFFISTAYLLNGDLKEVVLYNRIPGINAWYQAMSVTKPMTNTVIDIDIPFSTGASIASVIKDQYGEPVVGAKITHSSGTMATSNEKGEFILNVQYAPSVVSDPTIKLQADGFISKQIDISTFKKTDNSPVITDLGLSFWKAQVAELRTLTATPFGELGSEEAFKENFEEYNTTLKTFYQQDSVGVIALENLVQLRTYTYDKNKRKQYVPCTIALAYGQNKELEVPQEGITKLLQTGGTWFGGTIVNKDTTAKVFYVEEKFAIEYTPPPSKYDTVKIEIMLKEAVMVAGVVVGYDSDSTKLDVEEGVLVNADGLAEKETDEKGRFRIYLEKNAEEVELRLTKEGFNDAQWAFATRIGTKEDFLKGKKNFTTEENLRNLILPIYEKDLNIPEFKKIQGFKTEITSITRVSSDTYSIAGSIDVSEEQSIFEIEGDDYLSFDNVEVKVDEEDAENAILVEDDIDLLQETLNLKLYNYANVESNSEVGGNTNFLKLVKLKLEGNESYGKIGGASLKFLPTKVIGKDADPVLREFKLVPDLPNGEKEREYTEEDKNKAAEAKEKKAEEEEEALQQSRAKAKKLNAKKAAAAKAKAEKNEKKAARTKARADKIEARNKERVARAEAKAKKAKATSEKAEKSASTAEQRAAKAKEKAAKAKESVAKEKERAAKAAEDALKKGVKGKAAVAKAKEKVEKAKAAAQKAKENAAKANATAKKAKTTAKKAEDKLGQAEENVEKTKEAVAPKPKTDSVAKKETLLEKGKKFYDTKGKKMAIAQGKKFLKEKIGSLTSKSKGEEGEGEGDGEEEGEGDDEEDEEEGSEGTKSNIKGEDIIPVFVSGGKELNTFHADLTYKLEYPKEINGQPRPEQKDVRGKPTGKPASIGIEVGLGFEVLLDEARPATLSQNGVSFGGNLGFPKLPKMGIDGKMPFIKEFVLGPEESLPMQLLEIPKAAGKPYIVNLGMAKKWRFQIENLKFKKGIVGPEITGRIYTDSINHLIVNSMSLTRSNGKTYPNLDLEFPTEGFKISKLVIKNSGDNGGIRMGYILQEDAYQVEIAAKVSTTSDSWFAKKILPLDIEKFVYNSSGKFYMAVKANKTIELGPVKIEVRKVLFDKGGTVTWDEMQESLDEAGNLAYQKTNNKDLYFTSSLKDAINQKGAGKELMEEDDDTKVASDKSDWAFGFAGSVQITQLKGMTAKSGAAFILGERQGQFDYQVSRIEVSMEAPNFRADLKLRFQNSPQKVGFEGEGRLKTLKFEGAATFKFYKLPGGVEFEGTLVVDVSKLSIITGPLKWTKLGGGVYINTQDRKYSLILLGEADQTGPPVAIYSYKNLRVEILFELEKCGLVPVIKGEGELWIEGKKSCSAQLVIDFCRLSLMLNAECTLTFSIGMEATARATIYADVNTVFIGANAKVKFGILDGNGLFTMGYNVNFNDPEMPQQVTYYRSLIDKRFLIDGALYGIYVEAEGGSKSRVTIPVLEGVDLFYNSVISNKFIFYIPFKGSNLLIRNEFTLDVGYGVSFKKNDFPVLSLGLHALIEGGINDYDGVFFNADVDGYLKLAIICEDCNSVCWIGFKICIYVKVKVSYSQKRGGFSVKFF